VFVSLCCLVDSQCVACYLLDLLCFVYQIHLKCFLYLVDDSTFTDDGMTRTKEAFDMEKVRKNYLKLIFIMASRMKLYKTDTIIDAQFC